MVRTVVELFEIDSDQGTHLCSVYIPLHETFEIRQKSFVDNRVPISLVKSYAYILLVGLDYLRTKCSLIHTGELDHLLSRSSLLVDQPREIPN